MQIGNKPMTDAEKTDMIRQLNDNFRANMTDPNLGKLLITHSIRDKFSGRLHHVIAAIADFDGFEKDNDPYDEHDFVSVTVDGETIFWKVDYYDLHDQNFGSEDPADSSKTLRVATIMLASDY